MYFSSPLWNIKSWSLPTQHQVPVRFDAYIESPDCSAPGKICHWTANVFNFNSNPQLPIGAFDIRQCFSPNQRRLINFALIGLYLFCVLDTTLKGASGRVYNKLSDNRIIKNIKILFISLRFCKIASVLDQSIFVRI